MKRSENLFSEIKEKGLYAANEGISLFQIPAFYKFNLMLNVQC